jgi:hypothetical protein
MALMLWLDGMMMMMMMMTICTIDGMLPGRLTAELAPSTCSHARVP